MSAGEIYSHRNSKQPKSVQENKKFCIPRLENASHSQVRVKIANLDSLSRDTVHIGRILGLIHWNLGEKTKSFSPGRCVNLHYGSKLVAFGFFAKIAEKIGPEYAVVPIVSQGEGQWD